MSTSINTWFTADCHFSHTAILNFHPWRREAAGITADEIKEDKHSAIKRHDEWLINLWNETVKRRDNIYILGDLCLGNKERTESILQKLHGKKFLIRGNHDKSCNGLERYFEWVGDIKEVKFNNNQYPFIRNDETFCLEMCHFPMLSWNRRPHGTCHIHGHCHNRITQLNNASQELRVDVGLDSDLSDGNLLSIERIYEYMSGLIRANGCDTFKDYIELLMSEQGFRA